MQLCQVISCGAPKDHVCVYCVRAWQPGCQEKTATKKLLVLEVLWEFPWGGVWMASLAAYGPQSSPSPGSTRKKQVPQSIRACHPKKSPQGHLVGEPGKGRGNTRFSRAWGRPVCSPVGIMCPEEHVTLENHRSPSSCCWTHVLSSQLTSADKL